MILFLRETEQRGVEERQKKNIRKKCILLGNLRLRLRIIKLRFYLLKLVGMIVRHFYC